MGVAGSVSVQLITIRCDGYRKNGQRCDIRLGDVQKGAAYSFRCPSCNADKSGQAAC